MRLYWKEKTPSYNRRNTVMHVYTYCNVHFLMPKLTSFESRKESNSKHGWLDLCLFPNSATSKRLTFCIYGLPKFPVKQNMQSVNPFWAVRTEAYRTYWTRKKQSFSISLFLLFSFLYAKLHTYPFLMKIQSFFFFFILLKMTVYLFKGKNCYLHFCLSFEMMGQLFKGRFYSSSSRGRFFPLRVDPL